MRKLLFTLLVAVCFVPGVRAQDKAPKGCKEAYETFAKLQSAILENDYGATVAVFSDSLLKNYKDLDGKDLRDFINNYCFVNRDFLRALKTNHIKLTCKTEDEFTVFIYAKSRRQPDQYMDTKEDPDNADDAAGGIWYLKFRRIEDNFKVVVVDRAS